jgi:hypothetical protein
MTTPEPVEYPEAWRPKERRERDREQQLLNEFEQAVSALSDEDIRRIREANS